MRCVVLQEHGWCWACYARKRGRSNGHGKQLVRPDREFNPFEESDMAMARPTGDAIPGTVAKATDESLRGYYPTLHDWLTETTWEDGKARKTSTLLIMTENGRWKAFLNDRDGKRGAFLSAEAYEWLLESLEKALLDSSLEWRKDTR